MKNLFSKSVSRKNGVIAFAGFAVFAAALGIYLKEGTKIKVALTLNDKQTAMKSYAENVRSIVDEQNRSLHSMDYIFPVAITNLDNHLKIAWKQARQVEIVKDNEKKTVWTTAPTVAEFLKEQSIALKPHEEVYPRLFQPIKANMKIHIMKEKPLTLVDGVNRRKIWSASTTVADLLKKQGIKLNCLDRVEPSMNAAIKKNETIKITRVEKVTDVVEEPVKYAVISKLDPQLAKGSEKTLIDGVNGVNIEQYEVIMVNGKEAVRSLINVSETKSKQDKVVAVGTKELPVQASSAPISSSREFYVNATAYTANCNGCSGRTATGLNLRANPNAKVIAVDPRIIPLGTKVYVDGYGYAVAADTGGAIKGLKIDVFFSSNADAYRWGRKKVKVTVLN
jgi:uncharacterized protein YabE (DUF348 family)